MRVAVSFLILFIGFSCYAPKISEANSENTPLTEKYENDELEPIISPYRKVVDATMNEVIAQAETDFVKYQPQSPLSNLVADLTFEKGMAWLAQHSKTATTYNTFALLNFGGLRAPINKGAVTIGNVYELMPFDNMLCVVTLTPQKVSEFLTYIAAAEGQPIANAVIDYTAETPKIKIGGRSYNFDQNVHIITSDYLATGGDKMDFLKNPIQKQELNMLLRDVIIDYLKVKKRITATEPVDERIKFN